MRIVKARIHLPNYLVDKKSIKPPFYGGLIASMSLINLQRHENSSTLGLTQLYVTTFNEQSTNSTYYDNTFNSQKNHLDYRHSLRYPWNYWPLRTRSNSDRVQLRTIVDWIYNTCRRHYL